MKDKFQSKAVPRGTRTIWRYLSALILLFSLSIGQMWGTDYLINVESGNLSSDSKWYEVTDVGGVTNKVGSTWSEADYSCTPAGAKIGSKNFTVRTDLANTTQISVATSSTSSRTLGDIKTGTSLSSLSAATGCTKSGSVAKNTCDQVLTLTFDPALAAGTYVNIAVSGNLNVHSVTITATAATKHHVTYALNGGTGTTPTQADVAEGAKFTLHDGITGITAPSGQQFAGWNDGTTTYAGGAEYTMGTDDVELTAVWETAKTNPTATFSNGAYVVGASALDLSGLWSSNSDGAVTYALKEASDDASVSGTLFTATKAGSYVVTASQAATSTYNAIEKEATITVTWPATGAATITYEVKVGTGQTTLDTNKKEANSASISNLVGFTTAGGLEVQSGGGKTASSPKIATPTAKDDAKYVYVTFDVASGYIFTINSVTTKMVAVSKPCDIEVELSDATTNEALSYNQTNNNDPGADHEFEFAGKAYEGTVTLKIYAYGAEASSYRIGKPLTISGTVAVKPSPSAPAITDPSADQETEYELNATISPLTITATGYPTPTYQWYSNSSASTEGATVIEGAQSASYTPANNVASDLYYYCVATNSQGSATSHYFHVTVNAPAVPTIYTETTALTLTSNKVATASETFTFSGANLGETAVTLVLASEVDGLTLSESSVTPTTGAIADTEVTVSYKSLLDVAEATVDLYIKQGETTLKTIVLTYSSTAGIEDLTSISAATTWNWDHANSSTEAIESLDANDIVVFANYSGWDESFKANSLAGRLQYVYRGNNYAQGHNLKFNTTVPGIVTVSFSNTSTKTVARAPRITDVNGSYAPTDEADGAKTADAKSYSHAVAAGDVLIEGFEMQDGTPANMLRFYEVRFVPTFSVTYMPNGGSGAESIVDDAATEVRAGSIFTAPASSAFVEWNTQADGNGDTYLPGAAVTADLTLFAQWETSYMVTFDLQGHGDAIEPQNIVSGGKVVKPADPSADAWEFGGWYKESTCENEWDFATDVVTTTTTIFAKWTEDPCPTPFSLSKVVLTSATDGTVTGYNNDEYAGEKVIGGLGESQTADVDPSHEGVETGYKLSSGGSAIVFATLKKGTFQVGDRVVVTITKAQDAYKVEEVAQPILDIYYGTDKNDATFLTTIENVTAAGTYTYRLTAADVTAIGSKTGIGVFRPSSGRTQNPYVYSVEIKGCREWAIFHTLTFKNIDGTATIADESLEEGVAASTVAPAAPKIAMKRFLGWAEATDGSPVDLTTYTITDDKILYAVYEDIVCPTTGTVYKFQLKTDLTTGKIFTSAPGELTLNTTDHLSSMVNGEVTVNLASGKNTNRVQFYDGKAIGFANGDGASITLTLDCALATGDEIRFINYAGDGNKMNLSDGTHSLELNGNSAETVQKITVNSDWNGADELTLTRGNNTPKLTYFEIYRPAKYDVSFNMMGHGSAIADIEDVIEGSKITAPTAPTDEDYSFAGWYKENTLANEWKFDVDVVEANTTLYAKWLDKSDATLKSLKYGETEIALEAGVYTYNVSLPAFTSAVPALTAETSNPNATKVIANAAAFDSEGNATSTVTVTPEVGADQVYYVNFAKGVEILLQDVTGSITWNFANAVTANVNITGTPQVLANYGGVTNDNTFESDKLEASGEKFTAGTKANLRANYIHFHTTVPGMLTISYSNTGGSNPARYIYVNGAKYDEEGSASTTKKGLDNKVFVPAGDVELVMKDGEDASKNVQIYQMIFNATPDYKRNVTEGRYGTICLPTNGVMIGTTIYTLAFYGATSQKIFFDEVVTGRMEAGKPYLFLPEQGVTELKVFYTDSETKAAQTVNGFHGYIGDSEDPEDALPVPAGEGNYIVQNNTYREVQAGATAYILSHRAYIHFDGISTTEPAKAPGARRIGLGKDAAQGFENLQSGDQPMKVMIDGTLYIIRGEKVYNANGQVVK